ncbi:GBS Bsp-like repeat-containing protein, partial [Enterococcus quebecensis]
METSLESRKYIKLLAFVAVALSMTVVTLAFGLEETQAANAVNDYVKQGITNKKWVSPVEQNRTGQIKYKYPYEGGVGKPTKIINHETANNTSTIEGEISYMIRNQESAFVHEFVDANNIIKIADTNYLSWGSGPMGNKTGIQVEQVRMHSKDDFAKEIMNLATFNVNMLKQYGLKPTLGQSNGTGAIWTHAMVTRYLGGTDHVDPDQYWADRASRFFGTTYTINNFQELVEDMYYNRITDKTPANVDATSSVRQENGDFIVDVTVSGDTSRIIEVQVPTWALNNQQKDLKWYQAVQINANTYRATIPISNHKLVDNYLFHTYVRTNDGKFAFKAASSLEYKPAVTTANTTYDLINDKLVITAKLTGDTTRVSRVRFPLWRDPKQKDLVWYTATKKSDDTYEYIYDLKNVPYGAINVHTYVQTDGWQELNKATNGYNYKEPTVPKGKTTAKIEGGTVVLTSTFEGTKEELASVAKVEYPTWSVENASNKIWHLATKVNQTTYQARVDLKTYKRYGNYMTHSYITTTDSRLVNFAATSYAYKQPALPKGKTTAKVEGSTVVLTSTLEGTGEELASVAKVEYPTWSVENTGNKNWHLATKLNKTTYQARVDLKSYKHYGEYMTHSYITTIDNRLGNFAATSYTYKQPALPKGKTTAKVEGSTVVLTSTLEGSEESLASVAKVEYPT